MIILDTETGEPLPRDEQFKIMTEVMGETATAANLMLAIQFDGAAGDLVEVNEDGSKNEQ